MLVLTRKNRESIVIGDDIVVQILEVSGGKVRVGVLAPDQVRVVRGELRPHDLRNRRAGVADADVEVMAAAVTASHPEDPTGTHEIDSNSATVPVGDASRVSSDQLPRPTNRRCQSYLRETNGHQVNGRHTHESPAAVRQTRVAGQGTGEKTVADWRHRAGASDRRAAGGDDRLVDRDSRTLDGPLGHRGKTRANSQDRVPGDTVADVAYRRLRELQRAHGAAVANIDPAHRPAPRAGGQLTGRETAAGEVAEEVAVYRVRLTAQAPDKPWPTPGAGRLPSDPDSAAADSACPGSPTRELATRELATRELASGEAGGDTYWRMAGLNQYRADWYDGDLRWGIHHEQPESWAMNPAPVGHKCLVPDQA